MIPRPAAIILTSLCAVMSASPSRSAETKAPDPDLPQPLDLKATQSLLQSSPFTRALNLSDQLALTGIAYVQGKPVATLVDKTTKKSYLVSETPNAEGWRLAEANASNEIKRSEIKIIIGTETVTIRYSDTQSASPKKTSGYGPSRFPTEQEYTGHDENGKPYVRGAVYLSDEDRARYYNGGLSRDAHDKFRQILRDNRERMFAASPEERTAFAKKVFDAVDKK
jgi:hypothetical protein